jgi:hypothetical protein
MRTYYKVRFHLAAGEYYRKWQVRQRSNVTYYDPEKVCLAMINCRLRNSRQIAQKIKEGANKTVCAWIECENLVVQQISDPNQHTAITYNPKIQPHWVENGKDVDNKRYDYLYTNGRIVYRITR